MGGGGFGGGAHWVAPPNQNVVAAGVSRRRARVRTMRACEEMLEGSSEKPPKIRWRDRLRAAWRDFFPLKPKS